MTARFERHLAECSRCRSELEQLRELSMCINAATFVEIAPSELTGFHAAVDQVIDEQNTSLPLFRTVGILAALAASLLIICGIWWIDAMPAADSRIAALNRPAAPSPQWEQIAATLRAEPSPAVSNDSFFSPHYAATLEFMLNNLVITERKTWEKPKS